MKPNDSAQTATITLRVVFFIIMIVLSWLHVGNLFRGLNSPQGMEQAQIAREVARGNGLITKVIRPAAVRMNQEATDKNGSLADASVNTYHAPLNPLLLGAIFRAAGAQDFEKWRPESEEFVYRLDRLVAGFSIVCFLLSIGVTYLLVSRIFDAKIASTSAVLMLFCSLMWQFTMSGDAQMLMLLLFTSGCYFAYRAFEASEENQFTLLHSILAGVFFTLLTLTHWLAIWILIGYAIAAAIFIKPRGIAGIIALVLVIIAAVPTALQNIETTGFAGGVAHLVLHEGLGNGEEVAMRSYEVAIPNLRSVALNILRLTVTQTKELYSYFGAILAAPIFFIALLHPFKRLPISNFRWALLIMWISASIGMAIFGLRGGESSSNQLHILFAPLMGAYGLAILSVLWARLDFTNTVPLMGNAHLVAVVVISASPFFLSLPFQVVRTLGDNAGRPPNYPPYAPSILDDAIPDFTDSDDIIVSDQPWAVAWYADRRSIWLPYKIADLEILENKAETEDTPVVGVLITPMSSESRPLATMAFSYGDYMSLMLDNWATSATRKPAPKMVSASDRNLTGFHNRYPFARPLIFRALPMTFYTARNFGN